MQFKLQLVSITEDGKEKINDLVSIKKNSESIEQLGLSIKDSKEILNKLQKIIIDDQIDANIVDKNLNLKIIILLLLEHSLVKCMLKVQDTRNVIVQLLKRNLLVR